MPYFDTADGARLFYRDWGTGQPILHLASASLSSDLWQQQMLRLTGHGYRCIAYDRRGHGRSDDPGRGYDFDTLADDVAVLIQHLDLHDAILVSHSMGGGEIVRYLTRHGASRVARVALIAPTTPFILKTPDNPSGIDRSLLDALRAEFARDYPRWLVENTPPFVGEGLPGCSVAPETMESIRRDMLRTSLQATIEVNRAVTDTDFRAEMPSITVPALVIAADTDASTPLDLCGRPSADLLPNARLIVYENAAHGLVLTHLDRLSNDLLAFIQERPAIGVIVADPFSQERPPLVRW